MIKLLILNFTLDKFFLSMNKKLIINIIIYGGALILGVVISRMTSDDTPKMEVWYEMDCRTDLECWDKQLDSFFNTMLNDLDDGILDGEYNAYSSENNGVGWYELKKNRIDKMVDEQIQYQIMEMVKDKINKMERPKQKVIMDELGLVWY